MPNGIQHGSDIGGNRNNAVNGEDCEIFFAGDFSHACV